MPKVPSPVCDLDLENLKASGLTDETIRANKLRTEGGALVFPYRDLDGTLNGFARRRPHNPRIIDGKVAKYEQPKGSTRRAYFPVASLPLLLDDKSAIFITEGEKKALALAQLEYAAIGIGGIWCGTQKTEAGEHVLIDDLAQINWQGRTVYIVYDYDEKPQTRKDSIFAQKRLAQALLDAGASVVLSVKLPPARDGGKQGVDDYLALGWKAAEEFQFLVGGAIPVIKIIPSAYAWGKSIEIIPIIPPKLGEEAYHGLIGEFIRDVAPFTEATDAGILAHLLPAIGTLIGPGPRVHGTREPARLNTVLVGPTSTGRKGTALRPVDELMSLVDPTFWKEQRARGLSTGEGLVQRVADIKVWDDEIKEYQITPVEKRLYVVEEEFSKVLAQTKRDGNILSQVLRESFDSGNLEVMTRGNPIRAFLAHICLTGHITYEELIDCFNQIQMANGFGNRLAWFYVESGKIIARCVAIPESIYTKYILQLWRLNNYQAVDLQLAPPAMGKWEEEIYPYLRKNRPGMTGALLARGPSIVLRIALIYYLLDLPSQGDLNMPRGFAWSQGVSVKHLDAAMAVWDYCEQSVKQLFAGQRGAAPVDEPLPDKVLRMLTDGPKTEMNRHLSPQQKKEIDGVLASLEAAGQVVQEKQKKDGAGRPAVVWKLKLPDD